MFHIIVRDNCQWCDKAEALLEEKGFGYSYCTYNIGSEETDFRRFVRQMYRTVPQIWKDNHWIGGYEELKEHLASTD